MRRRAFGLATVLVLLSLCLWPTVRAEDIRVKTAFSALPPNASRYDKLANLANVSDRSLSNYNQTWGPFFDVNPDIKGITVTPLTAPAIIQQPSSTLRAVQRVTFGAEQIMSGASVSYWRAPLGNVSNSTLVTFKLYRVDSTTDNVTSIGADAPIFADPTQATLVYNYSGYPRLEPPFLARTFSIPIVPDMTKAKWVDLSSTLVDSLVWETAPTTNYGAGTELWVSQKDSTAQRSRTLVNWNTTSIPSNAIILRANLTLHDYFIFANGYPIPGQKIGSYPVTSSWTEGGVTWNTQPSIDGVESSATTSPAFPLDLSWNVTGSTKKGHDAANDRGVLLKYLPENSAYPDGLQRGEYSFFSSSENATVAHRPKLWVQWAPAKAFYKFVYLAVRAPIFSTKNYFAYWNVSGAGTHNYHLYYSEGDVAQDGIYDSWVRVNSNATIFIKADLDQSVVFTRGISNGVGGLVPTCAFYNVTCLGVPILDFSVAMSSATVGPALSPTFLNAIFPVLDVDVNGTIGNPDLILGGTLHFATGPTVDFPIHDIVLKQKYALAFTFWNLTALNAGALIGRTVVRVDFEMAIARNSSRFWETAISSAPWTNLTLPLAAAPFQYVIPFRFQLFGYFSVDAFFFDNTNKLIILIPVEEPTTDLGKAEVFHAWKSSILNQTKNSSLSTNCTAVLESRVWGYITSAGTKALVDTINGDTCLVNAIIAGAQFLIASTFRNLEHIFGPIGQWVLSIGTAIWQAIEFLIQTIQWFLFWAVKIINVFLVAVVFSIVVLAPSYVGKAFLEWVRNDYDADVLRDVMEEGWSRVWSLVHLIIMLVLIAISAISAVLPL